MKKEPLAAYKKRREKKILKEGHLDLSFGKGLKVKLKVKSVPYYIDEDKKVYVGIPEMFLKSQEDEDSIQSILSSLLETSGMPIWKEAEGETARWALEDFEKEQSASKEQK